ncbi:MAG: multicopper oxidase type 2 [Acidobacteriales bacterium]|nr:multicopper oxidase type 2 [Terriglobales bacterium]
MMSPPALRSAVASWALILMILAGVFGAAELSRSRSPGFATPASQRLVEDPPEVQSTGNTVNLELHAVTDAQGRDSFSFQGHTTAPLIRALPGQSIEIDYRNDMSANSAESCAISPCRNMSNLHFHGLSVSPHAPQDDVLSMMAMPGESLHYLIHIPKGHSPGLYWYHTHPHGESHRQVLDGMSGAIVIEGIEQYVPELRSLRERVLILRSRDLEHEPAAAELREKVGAYSGCGGEHETPERVFTVNSSLRPAIDMAPGEKQFWRIVNASPDQYADMQVDGSSWHIVALDGMPFAYHDPNRRFLQADHVLVPPAGRVEAIVSAPSSSGVHALRTRCVNTGPAGDPNAGMVLADIALSGKHFVPRPMMNSNKPMSRYDSTAILQAEKTRPQFVVDFTEDKKGFYINQQKYQTDSKEMVRVKVGSYQHWRITNSTQELHPMHIHQVHFLVFSMNDMYLKDPVWLDTVNVPVGGSVDVIMDFTDPVIRGMSLFHCHLLNHEDKGMMAKVLFE